MADTEAPASRDRGLDMLKVVALALVLVQHVTGELIWRGSTDWWVSPLNAASWVAVPLFFAASGYLTGKSWIRQGALSADWLARRVIRLAVPYAFWSSVYLVLGTVAASLRGSSHQPADLLSLVFWGGAFYTLWFLPALIHVTTAAWAIMYSRVPLLPAAGAAAAISLAGIIGRVSLVPPIVLRLAPLLAVYLASAWVGRREGARSSRSLWLAAGVMLVGMVVASAPSPGAARLLAHVAAVPLLLGFAGASGRWGRLVAHAARVSLGFYVIHGGVLYVFATAVPAEQSPALPWFGAACVSVGVISLGAAWGLSQSRHLRPMVV